RAMATARARASEPRVWLRPSELADVLRAYGIPLVETVFASSADEAIVAAHRLGYPVALKVASDSLTHKSEVGGVELDLRRDEELRDAWTRIAGKVRERFPEHGPMRATVQRMVTAGIEAIIGISYDPSFGPLIMFGLWGIHVELLKAVAFRIHPVTDRDAHEMVRAVRGFRLLEGFRG